MDAFRAVTANLGRASPSTGMAGRSAAAMAWACEQVATRYAPDLVFVQEMPADEQWLRIWGAEGYDYVVSEPVYKARSALLWRTSVITRAAQDWGYPTAAYHGSYVAAVLLQLSGFDSPVAALSVHASPRPVTDEEKATWQSCGVDLPAARQSGGRHDGQLFDSDMVLESLRLIVERDGDQCEVLAAGDLNECRKWDDDHPPETWGHDFFGGPTSAGLVQRAGLRPVLHELWNWEEQPTSFGLGLAHYQLDHVLATPSLAATITADSVAPPDEPDVAAGRRSDHAPVSFAIGRN